MRCLIAVACRHAKALWLAFLVWRFVSALTMCLVDGLALVDQMAADWQSLRSTGAGLTTLSIVVHLVRFQIRNRGV
jgi:hypothetical protein